MTEKQKPTRGSKADVRANPAKGRSKSEALVISERRGRVVELYLQGRTQGEIAVELKVDRTTLWRDLEVVRQEWLADRIKGYDRLKQIELQRIDRVEAAAWEGYERSCEDAVTVKETISGKSDDSGSTETTTKGQAGNPSFLQIIIGCSRERRTLLGLDAPTKVAPTTPEGDEPYSLTIVEAEKKLKDLTTEQLQTIAAARRVFDSAAVTEN